MTTWCSRDTGVKQHDALASGRFKRDPACWETEFGRWVADFGVPRIVKALARDPDLRVTNQAVYEWLQGHPPRPARAMALVGQPPNEPRGKRQCQTGTTGAQFPVHTSGLFHLAQLASVVDVPCLQVNLYCLLALRIEEPEMRAGGVQIVGIGPVELKTPSSSVVVVT